MFSGLSGESGHFPPGKSWAVTFRVRDLTAMIDQLEAAGVAVTRDPEIYPNGSFATLIDPEGNGIQLWEPAGSDT
ncbi:VOC family protein [Arthrobacter sp. Soc17.1.1.1]|uniref:VOC family protein n=1 Tax=Arthrobacter sp. Soc17.1.1.1 TaxID=3121277 RepID=UPI003FA53EE3